MSNEHFNALIVVHVVRPLLKSTPFHQGYPPGLSYRVPAKVHASDISKRSKAFQLFDSEYVLSEVAGEG